MIYVLALNQTVETYPYSIGALRRDNPNTSFPRNPSDAMLASWNVFPVTDKPAPDYNPATENCNQVDPTFVDDQWVMMWRITSATPKQIAERTEAKAAEVRQRRNELLTACDWTQLPDAPLDADAKLAWQLYRETLRMVPEQAGFPWNVEWPPLPGED
jgi:hypothetical protein